MKYIRTKDGRIVDLEKFINEEKDTRFYTDFIFDEITKDGYLKWTAVGTDKNTIEGQKGIRCQFGATLNSDIIKQADTIEELCDEFRGVWTNYCEDGKDAHEEYHYDKEKNVFYDDFEELTHKAAIEKFDIFYGAIWTDKGLVYVAKMNEKGELELL